MSVPTYAYYLASVNMLFLEGRLGILAIITPATATIQLLIAWALLLHLGVLGAAIATAASYALQAAFVRMALHTRWNFGGSTSLRLLSTNLGVLAVAVALASVGHWSAVIVSVLVVGFVGLQSLKALLQTCDQSQRLI